MLQVKEQYLQENGVGLENNTTRYHNDGTNIIILNKDRYGNINTEEIPVENISCFQPFMQDNREDISIFDRLSRDFNMSPEEVSNPFMISSRHPRPTSMPYQNVRNVRIAPHKSEKRVKKRRSTPVKKTKSPRKRKTERTYKPFGNKNIKILNKN